MNKIFLATVAVLLGLAASAQDSARYNSALVPGTKWYEVFIGQEPGHESIGEAYAGLTIDTTTILVGNAEYHIVNKRYYSDFCIYSPVACLRETEDHSKIYGRFFHVEDDYTNLSDEVLLMNLELNVGDTFELKDQIYALLHSSDSPKKAVVDSVYYQDGLKHVRFASFRSIEQDEWERTFEMPYDPEGILNRFTKHAAFEFIESIGCTWGYSYYAEESFPPFQHVMSRLLCFYRNDELIYTPWEDRDDLICIMCNTWDDIDTADTQSHIEAFPNPVMNYLTLSQMPYGEKTILVQDINGRTWQLIKTREESIQIDMTRMPPKIYLLRIKNDKNNITKKIIKY